MREDNKWVLCYQYVETISNEMSNTSQHLKGTLLDYLLMHMLLNVSCILV